MNNTVRAMHFMISFAVKIFILTKNRRIQFSLAIKLDKEIRAMFTLYLNLWGSLVRFSENSPHLTHYSTTIFFRGAILTEIQWIFTESQRLSLCLVSFWVMFARSAPPVTRRFNGENSWSEIPPKLRFAELFSGKRTTRGRVCVQLLTGENQ